jgi:hypothetical protein
MAEHCKFCGQEKKHEVAAGRVDDLCPVLCGNFIKGGSSKYTTNDGHGHVLYIPDDENPTHIIHERIVEDADGTLNIRVEVLQGVDITDGVLWVVRGDEDMPIGKLVTD